MKVSVVIGYGDRGGWEHRLFEWCERWWAENHPGYEIIVDGAPGEVFNRSHARNLGVRRCTGDVLIFANADTVFVTADELRQLVDVAADGGWGLSAAYTETTRAYVDDVFERGFRSPADEEIERTVEGSPAGVQVIGREAFRRIGGWDERFAGWGYEDTAFRLLADTFVEPHVKVGTAVHLWHARPADSFKASPVFRRNQRRWFEMKTAAKRGRMHVRRYITPWVE